MTVPTPALRAVVEGFGLSAPFREMLRAPSRVLLSDTGVESVRPWFGMQRVDEILSVSTLDPYVVTLHDRLDEVDQRRFVVAEVGDGQIVKRTLRAGTVRDALQRGLTLTINGADRFEAVTLHNREFLEYAAGTIAWCNVYVARSAMSPFDTHSASLSYSLLDTESVPLGDIRIRFGSRLPPVLGLHEKTVLVVAAGSLYKVDRRLLPVLTMLSDGVNVPASALSIKVGEKAVRTFIQWGVGNGLLIANIERTEQS